MLQDTAGTAKLSDVDDFIEIKIQKKKQKKEIPSAAISYKKNKHTTEINLPQPQDISETSYPYHEWYSKRKQYTRHGRMFLLKGINELLKPQKIREGKGGILSNVDFNNRNPGTLSLSVDYHQNVDTLCSGVISTTTSPDIAKCFAENGFVYGILNIGSVTTTNGRYEEEYEYSIPGGADWEDCVIYRQVKESWFGFQHQYVGSVFIRKKVLEKYPEDVGQMCQCFLEENEYIPLELLTPALKESQPQHQDTDNSSFLHQSTFFQPQASTSAAPPANTALVIDNFAHDTQALAVTSDMKCEAIKYSECLISDNPIETLMLLLDRYIAECKQVSAISNFFKSWVGCERHNEIHAKNLKTALQSLLPTGKSKSDIALDIKDAIHKEFQGEQHFNFGGSLAIMLKLEALWFEFPKNDFLPIIKPESVSHIPVNKQPVSPGLDISDTLIC